MRKVVFTIDDLAYFQHKWNLTDDQMRAIFPEKESFRAVYTLYGNGHNAERYELSDQDGNKIALDSLNGYEKGIIIADCYDYFSGGKYFDGMDKPCGVVEIEEYTI